MHCYTTPEDIQDEQKLAELANFCHREVGLVIDGEYIAIREEKDP